MVSCVVVSAVVTSSVFCGGAVVVLFCSVVVLFCSVVVLWWCCVLW